MFEIVNTILPVFMIIAAGYVVMKTNYLSSTAAEALNTFAARFAVPVLLFRAIYNLEFDATLQWPVLASFYIGVVVSFVIAGLLAKTLFKRRPGEAIAVGFCAFFSNTVMLGLPISERAFGPEILPWVYGIIAFHAPFLYAMGMISMEFARSDGRTIGQTLKVAVGSIFSNPLMIGIVAGAILNKLSVPIPSALEASVEMVASTAIPLALFGIGAVLPRYKMKSELSETAMVTVVSLIIHPTIAFLISYYLLGLQAQYVQVVVIIAAMPPGMNIYIFALMYDRAVALSASTVLVATSASIITITGWLWFLVNFQY